MPFESRSGLITSRNHPRIRQIRDLRGREERARTGLFFVEGLRFAARALEHGARIEAAVFARELLKGPFARKLLRDLRRAGCSPMEVTPEVFHSLAHADDPQGVGVVVRQRWETLAQVRPDAGLCWVALSTVQSPGNLGTIVRTAEAVGAAGILLIDSDADPYEPSAVRASMGALFAQRFVRASAGELIAWKRRHRCLVAGTSPSALEDYQAVRYPAPVVLFMGWERQGLSPEHQALCDRMVRIPMVGLGDSLNIAVATGVMLYEIFNQWRTESG